MFFFGGGVATVEMGMGMACAVNFTVARGLAGWAGLAGMGLKVLGGGSGIHIHMSYHIALRSLKMKIWRERRGEGSKRSDFQFQQLAKSGGIFARQGSSPKRKGKDACGGRGKRLWNGKGGPADQACRASLWKGHLVPLG